MTPQEMWRQFTDKQIPYEAWPFGAAADELAALTLAGIKRATSSAQAVYEKEGARIPQAGDYSVILDSHGDAVCIIRTAQVEILPYCKITAEQAELEGEGDLSLDYWRSVHEPFFTAELAACGLEFSEDTPVVFERFEKVWPPEPENRYPWADEYLLSLPGATKDFKAEWGWTRYQVGGKMFAAVCAPGAEHKLFGGHKLLTLKCDPALSELLRSEYAEILPGFYMDKRCWISVLLDGGVSDELLRDLCCKSHALVFEKLTKKAQREILQG